MAVKELTGELRNIVGKKGLMTGESRTAYYRSGFRSGFGEAIAVVFPNSLFEFWQVLQACVQADCAIIMQATKTGLTEGSSPSGFDYDREVVIINVTRIKKIIRMLITSYVSAINMPPESVEEGQVIM